MKRVELAAEEMLKLSLLEGTLLNVIGSYHLLSKSSVDERSRRSKNVLANLFAAV